MLALTKHALTVTLITALPLTAIAAPQQWQLDNTKTGVKFSVDYLKQGEIDGQFHDINGTIDYDVKKPEATAVEFRVKSASVDTGMRLRDAFLRQGALLNVKRYPTMHFVSKKVSMITPKQANITGDFTVLGQTKPLTVKVTLSDIKPGKKGARPTLNFRATGKVNRLDYGVTAFSNVVGTMIPIDITGQLVAAD